MKKMKGNRPLSRRGNSGFSLMEMLIVLGIMGMLVGIVIANFQGIFEGAEEDTARQMVKQGFETPLMSYRLHMNGFPSTEEGLQALVTAPSGPKASRWKGPYFKDARIPVDPWGNPFQYRYPGQKNPNSYDLWSMGKDGQTSADDIGNWE